MPYWYAKFTEFFTGAAPHINGNGRLSANGGCAIVPTVEATVPCDFNRYVKIEAARLDSLQDWAKPGRPPPVLATFGSWVFEGRFLARTCVSSLD